MLAVDDLAVRYGPIAALRGVSITVDEGEFVGIVGPNGAGKSTLLFSITGAVKAETGSVSFCGETLSGLAPEDIVRRGMALVPEGRELFGELTVEENLRLGATIRRDRRGVEEDVRAQMAAFPILRERRRARAEKLSGGEQQMLAVARALMGRPRMLLLDEPSLGLAPLITRQVYQTLTGLNREGMTILVVEQNPARIIDVARRVYVLRSGRIARTGQPDILSRGRSWTKPTSASTSTAGTHDHRHTDHRRCAERGLPLRADGARDRPHLRHHAPDQLRPWRVRHDRRLHADGDRGPIRAARHHRLDGAGRRPRASFGAHCLPSRSPCQPDHDAGDQLRGELLPPVSLRDDLRGPAQGLRVPRRPRRALHHRHDPHPEAECRDRRCDDRAACGPRAIPHTLPLRRADARSRTQLPHGPSARRPSR